MNQNNKEKKIKFLSESVLLALAPFIAGGLYLFFITSYSDYFRIPGYLVRYDIGDLHPWISLFLVYCLPMFLFLSLEIKKKPFWIIFFSLFACVFVAYKIFHESLGMKIFSLYFLITFLMKMFKEENYFPDDIKWSKNIVLFSGCLLAIVFMMDAGKGYAANMSEFTIIERNPEMVVLLDFRDSFVCTTFDRATQKIGKEFSIIQISDIKDKLHREKIGPLKPAD